jgi:hypothetical protein
MRFAITLNMPSHKGNLVHQVVGDYPVDSLEEFLDELAECEFIIVDEIYKDDITKESRVNGPIGINRLFVGKVKALRD